MVNNVSNFILPQIVTIGDLNDCNLYIYCCMCNNLCNNHFGG